MVVVVVVIARKRCGVVQWACSSKPTLYQIMGMLCSNSRSVRINAAHTTRKPNFKVEWWVRKLSFSMDANCFCWHGLWTSSTCVEGRAIEAKINLNWWPIWHETIRCVLSSCIIRHGCGGNDASKPFRPTLRQLSDFFLSISPLSRTN